ncbi:TniQ family protein [Ruegeria atlantica]|uniref:TniQ family protein n=1 Tax=Ruegeria atlantica TaxID=81569 RepID=UPI00147ACEC1
MPPRSITPEPDESLVGFLRREAREHGYLHVSEFFGLLGLPYGRPMVEALPKVADKLGVPLHQLEAIAPAEPATQRTLQWRFQRTHIDPYCPICLKENRFWRQSWRHCLVSACPIHHTRLEETCPRCDAVITTKIGGLQTCECGQDLSDRLAVEADPFEIWISELIASGGCGSSFASGFGPWCDDAPNDLASFVYFAATGSAETRTGKQGKTPLPKNLEETRSFLRLAEPLFQNWPSGFNEHVRIRLAEGDISANSAPAQLGKWYQRLMAFRGEAYEPFHDRLHQTVGQHFEGSYSVGVSSDRAWISAAEASRQLGVRAERVVAAVAAGALRGRQSTSGYGHKHTMVPRDEVEVLIAGRDNYLSAKDAMAFLGVGKNQFNLMQEAGMVVREDADALPALVDGPFDLRKLKALQDQIRIGDRGECHREAVAFRDINLRRTTDRSALLAFYKRISEGTIAPAYADQDSRLGDFRFAANDFTRALQTSVMAVQWTAHQIAKITGWKAEVVVHWCRTGFLASTSSPHASNEKFLISPQDLSAFQREYIPLADLARQKGTSSKALRNRLLAAGFDVVGEKKVGTTSRGALVRIADLSSILS